MASRSALLNFRFCWDKTLSNSSPEIRSISSRLLYKPSSTHTPNVKPCRNMASRGCIAGMSAHKFHFFPAIIITRHIFFSKASYSSRIDPNAPDLIEWIRDEGGFVHPGLRLDNEGSSGLGLVSSRVISAGTDIISLPRHIPLALPPLHSGLDHPDAVIIDLARRLPEELWTLRLGLKLLSERAKMGSFWWPYISNLPQAFNVPIFFSREEIENLQYIPLIHQHPFGGQCVDAATLGWAMSAVSTRAFRLHDNIMYDGKHGSTPMLLPLIDMCNHNFQANARIFQEADSCAHRSFVKVVAEKQIGEHTPISLNYGSLCNDLLLLDYGFVIPENKHDYLELKYDKFLLDTAAITAGVQSTAFTSPALWQEEILSQLKLHGDQAIAKVTLGGTELVDGGLLAALRVLFAKDIESTRKCDLNSLQSLTVEAPLGVVNESNVFRTIVALCVIALEYFPTKTIEDEMMLRGGNSEAMKLAITYRLSKKELLLHVMKNLTRRLKSMG